LHFLTYIFYCKIDGKEIFSERVKLSYGSILFKTLTYRAPGVLNLFAIRDLQQVIIINSFFLRYILFQFTNKMNAANFGAMNFFFMLTACCRNGYCLQKIPEQRIDKD
jgi:hypothetical protein